MKKIDKTPKKDIEWQIQLEKERQSLEARSEKILRAYLVNIELPEDCPKVIQESLKELSSLVKTLDDLPVGVMVQRRDKPVPSTLIGKGKAEEIGKLCHEYSINYVVFDRELSPNQLRVLEKVVKKPVIDRTTLILQIFKKNAKSQIAKTQVEIARSEYLLPRISNAWISWERQKGGSGGPGSYLRGSGETYLEVERRRLRDRITLLKKDLEKLHISQSTRGKKRRGNAWNAVFVGYTNAGKTTLMNYLTSSSLSVRDRLFETLDSNVRRLDHFSENIQVLMTDTVGFIRNLPHSLVASFQNTLKEACYADLLLHVVDVSDPKYSEHIQVTLQVLKDIGAGDIPMLYIFNKFDKYEGTNQIARVLKRNYPFSIVMEAHCLHDIKTLKKIIVDFFTREMLEKTFKVHYQNSNVISILYSHSSVLESKWEDNFLIFDVKVTKSNYKKFFHPLEPELGVNNEQVQR